MSNPNLNPNSQSQSKSKSKTRSKIPSFLNLSASASGANGNASVNGNVAANLFPFRPFKSSNLAIPTSPLFSPRSPLSPPAPPAPPSPSQILSPTTAATAAAAALSSLTSALSSKTARSKDHRSNSSSSSSSSTDSKSALLRRRKNKNKNKDGFPFFSNNVFDDVNDVKNDDGARSSRPSPPCSPLSSSSSMYPSPPSSPPAPPSPPPPPSSPPPPPPPPPRPMPWTWQCHLCHRRYPLGVTRRCLDDGHYFCSGVTEVRSTGARRRGSGSGSGPKTKRIKRHRACQSEFDYDGWKAWGEWRRGVLQAAITNSMRESMQNAPVLAAALSSPRRFAVQLDGGSGGNVMSNIAVDIRNNGLLANGKAKKNCSGDCDYPSECRWKKQMTVRTPESVSPGFFSGSVTGTATAPGKDADNSNNGMDGKASVSETLLPTVFEEDDNSNSDNDKKLNWSSQPTTVKTVMFNAVTEMVPKDDFWNSLLASVARRRSLSVKDDSIDLSDLVADAMEDGRSASV